jgi:hypothetical protein
LYVIHTYQYSKLYKVSKGCIKLSFPDSQCFLKRGTGFDYQKGLEHFLAQHRTNKNHDLCRGLGGIVDFSLVRQKRLPLNTSVI